MSKIVYAWELGGGYGHIGAFLAVAKQLQQRGHDVVFVLKNLEHADTLLGKYGFSYLQAPMRWPVIAQPPAINYAGILRNTGFNEAGLLARAQAWKTLITCLQPDLLLFDHAPTALVATRELKVPRALFGSGFYAPPRLSPMPTMLPYKKFPEKQLIDSETQIVASINAVIDRLGGQRLSMLADLFDVEQDFLCTLPELDHYQQREQAEYWGPAFIDTDGLDPTWPMLGDKRIFAYLHKDYKGLPHLLEQLRSTSCSVLVHIPGATQAFLQKYSGANLHVSAKPLNMRQVGQQCDLVICHAGAGTVATMLLAGKPLLLLPMHIEAALTASNVVALGAGVCIPSEVKKPNYRAAVKEMLAHRKYHQKSAEFADKYASFNREKQDILIADRCVEMIG
ncbi:nucleotide disphospho-sugar-binding domain-containing protein [Methylomarinum sp. Ch1-1]|uniref:Nucleotide disphospho-sugar-binding domain-containing protein n=1 Tax=Methylomarinum roseum TaxID=3067653 RepID=A0AAU7NYK7_9GAMM|nr:nucleotide disphospho-sugar-binding domain-containing protein [Methylomarinum sp. Ch1-1]MDP4521862.1 glycosyltransferase [Methylomarinum sp. Ch1-1]